MNPVSRRSFLGSATALGVAGVAGATGVAAITKAGDKEPELQPDELEILNRPVVVQIKDAETGEIELLVGDKEVVFKDKALVAKVLRASR